MPVDYIKAWLKGANSSKLINNPKFTLSYEKYEDKDTGECSRMILKHKNLNIIIYRNERILLTGSLHYFYNDGLYNYDNFTYQKLILTLKKVSELVEVKLIDIILLNIEFGVNITPYLDPNLIIHNMHLHRGKEFLKPYNFNYRAAKHQRFWIKIYNKGEQFKRKENILRIELKYIKMLDLNKLDLHTFEDLQNKALYPQLLKLLIAKWNESILYDYSIKTKYLKPLLAKKTLQYQNTNYWLQLSNQQRKREKDTLKNLSVNYGTDIQKEVSNLIIDKWHFLT